MGAPSGLPGGPVGGGGGRVDRAPKWLLGLACLVVLAVIGGGAYLVSTGGNDYPSDWDSRIDPIARWVESERHLDFSHPVQVNFLSEAEYRKAATGEDGSGSGEPDAEEQQDDDDTVAQLRALGFVSGKVDLDEASDTLNDSGTLAFYDPATEEVYVRGNDLTPALRVTLAHELTHVLQDQHFDLDRMDDLDDGRATVLRALAEGDAERIELAYADDVLTDEEREAYEEESAESGDEATEEIDDKVPPIMTAMFAAPYIFGPTLVDFLDQDGGNDAIDAALEDPPTEEVLFNPLVHGTDAAKPDEVSVERPDGSESIDDGEFGSTAWYLLLASRMEPAVALEATDGLGGDAYVVYRKGGKVCAQVRATGDEPSDLDELHAALETWVDQSPSGSASVELEGTEVAFRSCDPGAKAANPGEVSVDLLSVPVTRTQIYLDSLASGADEDQATCFADAIVSELTIEQLTSETFGSSDDEAALIDDLASACR